MSASPSRFLGVADPVVRWTGLGAWPGTDPFEASKTVLGLLGEPNLVEAGAAPFLPVLSERGPGSDPTGRSAALLRGVSLELQPYGWRIGRGDGIDARRAHGALSEDLEALQINSFEVSSALVVPVLGPASLWGRLFLPGGERVVSDPGARRDLAAAVVAGYVDHLVEIKRRMPSLSPVLLISEPDALAVAQGRFKTASGYRRNAPVDWAEIEDIWKSLISAVGEHHVPATLSMPGEQPQLMRASRAGARGVSISPTELDAAQWEELAHIVEAGREVWAGIARPCERIDATLVDDTIRPVWQWWNRLGLDPAKLDQVAVTTIPGLGTVSPAKARSALTLARDCVRELGERSA